MASQLHSTLAHRSHAEICLTSITTFP